MKTRAAKIPRCNCDHHHEVNGHKSDGTAIKLWTCPAHGNLFEESAMDISLTPFQEEVLQIISAENKAGRSPTAEELSWKVNRTVRAVRQAMAVLQAVNFIEPGSPS